jgi:calcineurin-like phosphoesterase family protein
MIYVFSDPHFFHGQDEGEPVRGVIKHCNRPFPHRTAMNEAMWNNINRKVGADDLLICNGDWVYGVGRDDDHYIKCCQEARYNIRCKNVWITHGNHDRHWLERWRKIFDRFLGFGYELMFTEEICDKFDVHEFRYLDEEQRYEDLLVCCHYKLCVWNRSHFGTKHVYGHSHGSFEKRMPIRNSRDVSVDCIGFEPQSLTELWQYFKTQEYLPLADHHEGER